MAAIHDLLAQIQDEALRDRIEQEVNRLTKTKKFGLVFEQHLPECTPLYDMPIKAGVNVMLRDTKDDKSLYVVLKIEEGKAICGRKDDLKEQVTFSIQDIVRVAEFGEPIYPYLEPIDSICGAPNSNLWHTLIEADNYHALQLLEYLYAGKVDCIYIDPPYNTGAKDWKYNNDYVDSSDSYRHSKWLSFIEKRLRIAKRLLNPKDSVLIVTIDEKEYLHLGCLLEEMFSEANIQMISMVINRRGAIRTGEFSRTNEFVFFVMMGKACPGLIYEEEGKRDDVKWVQFRRSDLSSKRGSTKGGTAQFYPIYINDKTKKIEKVGEAIKPDVNRLDVEKLDGCTTVFPVRKDGTEMNWGLTAPEFLSRVKKGYVRVGSLDEASPQKYPISYLTSSYIDDIESGRAKIIKYADDGHVICQYQDIRGTYPTTQWDKNTHDAKTFGTDVIDKIIGKNKFTFPKSIYSVKDALNLFVSNKPDALIIDFFAGSGTTLHAVNLLNSEDDGNRRCIMVTNNEVSGEEAKSLNQKGIFRGEPEWNALGIARNVTWPRTVNSIKGVDASGNPLDGTYYGSDRMMSDGFAANAIFFKLGFLDKTAVALGMQLKELIPILWMKAGAIGECPILNGDYLPDMLVYEKNRFAVLVNENEFSNFVEEIEARPGIQTVYLITDYEVNYRSMVKSLNVEMTYQLYRDYLDNFRINHGRN